MIDWTSVYFQRPENKKKILFVEESTSQVCYGLLDHSNIIGSDHYFSDLDEDKPNNRLGVYWSELPKPPTITQKSIK